MKLSVDTITNLLSVDMAKKEGLKLSVSVRFVPVLWVVFANHICSNCDVFRGALNL